MHAPQLDRLVPEYIKRFEPYIPSKPDNELKKLYGCKRLLRLNNNENPLGPPPAARDVIDGFPPPAASVYPSGDAYYLRYKLAEKFGLHPDQFLVGNGANEVITFVIKAFCQEGDNIVTADKTFAVYEWVAEFSGFDARLVPLKDFGFDDAGMLRTIDNRTKLIFVCNPNNPTGTYWSREKLLRFLDVVDGRQIVVLDEAYFEFVEKEDFPDGMALMESYPNLVVFRTFSKMYALAGLRIGYLAGSREVVDIIRRTCVVYSVNSLAQQAALATLEDGEHITRTRRMVREGRNFLERELGRLELSFVSGEGNYLMLRLPMSDTLAYRKFMTRGIMIRSMTGFRFPNYIRITISHMEAMEAFIEALEAILAEMPDRRP
ncbi:MAG: histidinol-phosphate transaminase [Deltaproteobacteria bacterium CG_4_8_14_3_um_filter_51_11]|nr:histidinol-phosphate transaminase [bacterium]OIP39781.1 MAG: histidinol-phosphate transaminase [Desulfobacteraceae bacterium CG2_30_51_40]PIP45786.1 MAG: histidinol-phosphate transaminase [Deltaproteobacteria bacterium CG23_combo_of_CG06-09_8_20_14_all_51_20]PIX18880.1 MAG: histidinol-phosphate transaminase [Deltaproteobacteria bacterium CG_4_8_14_3_um_filter_51_11]PJB33283.1 MAG: histidinol-phosphate transaminase [Deltaproteobacteria bacterium CG_4_9_14_3_um_filter_51_14]